MNTYRVIIKISILAFITASCMSGAKSTPAEPTPILGPQLTETAIIVQTRSAQNTLNAQSTQQAAKTATAIMQKTQKVLDMLATSAEQKSRSQSTSTARAAEKQTATAEAEQQATAQAQGMVDKLKEISTEAGLGEFSGKYYRLDDYEANLAQINYFDIPYFTGHTVENFAISANISWDSASDKANWDRSGCGFLFGYGVYAEDYYDLIFLNLQGYVRFFRPQPGSNTISSFASRRYSGEITRPKGEAEELLVVKDKRAHYYVNGEEVLNEYEGMMKPGFLFYAMVSGTNKGFGTLCKWSNVDLWLFE